MCAKARQAKRGQIIETCQHIGELIDCDSEAAHPRIDLHMYVDPAAATRSRRPEAFEIADLVDDGREALRDDVVLVPVVVGAEYEDRGSDARGSQFQALFHQRNRQCVAERLERAGHGDCTMTIGIRLDHPENGDRLADDLAKPGQISLYGAQIDLGDRRTDGGADVDFGKWDVRPL